MVRRHLLSDLRSPSPASLPPSHPLSFRSLHTRSQYSPRRALALTLHFFILATFSLFLEMPVEKRFYSGGGGGVGWNNSNNVASGGGGGGFYQQQPLRPLYLRKSPGNGSAPYSFHNQITPPQHQRRTENQPQREVVDKKHSISPV